jgi:uncharacterized protein (DUF924 family)
MIQSEVLEIWFGDLNNLVPLEERRKRWFNRDDEFDAFLKERFQTLIESGYENARKQFDDSPLGGLAQIILFDQFSRNIFRGSPKAFENDLKNVEFVHSFIAARRDQSLTPHQSAFSYMPLMHSEALENQEKCLSLFESLKERAPEEVKSSIDGFIKAAHYHMDPIKRFGRFPYRNKVLGRESTEEEIAFLKTKDSWP